MTSQKVNTMPTGITDTTGLQSARRALTGCRLALQEARDEYELERARAEQRALIKMNGSAGRNEEERRRNLTVALAEDEQFIKARRWLRQCEAQVAEAERDLEIALDQRRAEEWGIRLQLVVALDRAGVRSDAPGDDSSIDDAADEEVMSNLAQYREWRQAHAAQIDTNRAYREMDEVFGVQF